MSGDIACVCGLYIRSTWTRRALWHFGGGASGEDGARGQTRCYTRRPQLERFKAHQHPCSTINAYLAAVQAEANHRGYAFDRSKIGPVRTVEPIMVNSGQLALEWQHLRDKLSLPSPAVLVQWNEVPASGVLSACFAPRRGRRRHGNGVGWR